VEVKGFERFEGEGEVDGLGIEDDESNMVGQGIEVGFREIETGGAEVSGEEVNF